MLSGANWRKTATARFRHDLVSFTVVLFPGYEAAGVVAKFCSGTLYNCSIFTDKVVVTNNLLPSKPYPNKIYDV